MKILKRGIMTLMEEWLFRNKVLILYGARQVGKTTLAKSILAKYQSESGYFNCELLTVHQLFERQDLNEMKQAFSGHRILVFDEAQHIHQIGWILKMLNDSYPEMQIIATGSSSFSLSSQLQEPLTGRALEFMLYPFSYSELKQIYTPLDLKQAVYTFLRFGQYPEMIDKSEKDRITLLHNLTSKYLFKDIFEFENLKRPEVLLRLLQALALQVGSEVSFHQLSNHLSVHVSTVQRYLELLEKAFVIYRLKPLSRNLRTEINTKEKCFFYDLGIRNALINNFNPMELRDDVGAIWENFCLVERLKFLQTQSVFPQNYFWRTHSQKEIDYVEERNGVFHAYEFQWNPKAKQKNHALFEEHYHSSVQTITPINLNSFISK
jgi:hypothetical protein